MRRELLAEGPLWPVEVDPDEGEPRQRSRSSGALGCGVNQIG
jgi:hypothetical protein